MFRPAPISKRLWQGATAVALFLVTVFISNLVISRERAVTRSMLGHDFLAFYTAGAFVRTGRVQQLYDVAAVKQFEQDVARQGGLDVRDAVGPFWNPPFYASVFAPLSRFSFDTALKIWIGINLLAMIGAIALLCRMLPGEPDRRIWLLIPMLILVSMPFIQATTHAQNTAMSLLLLASVVTAWRKHWDILAGALCGLLFYKPQLALIIAVVLVVSRGMRVCLGLSCVLGLLCLVTALTMPNAIGDYLHRLPINVHFMQVENEYLWERHATLKAFWRLLIQGRSAGEPAMIVSLLTTISCLGIVIGLIVAVIRDHRAPFDDIFTGETRSIRRDRLIAATIAAMPLLMPFYFDYDLLLLSVPAVLFGGELWMRAPGQPLDRNDRLLIGTWVGLYLWMMINPGLGRMSGLNVSVVLLATVAALLIRRACRPVEPQQFGLRAPEVIRVSARRAA